MRKFSARLRAEDQVHRSRCIERCIVHGSCDLSIGNLSKHQKYILQVFIFCDGWFWCIQKTHHINISHPKKIGDLLWPAVFPGCELLVGSLTQWLVHRQDMGCKGNSFKLSAERPESLKHFKKSDKIQDLNWIWSMVPYFSDFSGMSNVMYGSAPGWIMPRLMGSSSRQDLEGQVSAARHLVWLIV